MPQPHFPLCKRGEPQYLTCLVFPEEEPWPEGPGIGVPALVANHLLCDFDKPSCTFASAQLQTRWLRSCCSNEMVGVTLSSQPVLAKAKRSPNLSRPGHQAQVRAILTPEVLPKSPHLTSVPWDEGINVGKQRENAEKKQLLSETRREGRHP